MNLISQDECFKKLTFDCKILDIIENHIPHAEWEWIPWNYVCVNLPYKDLEHKDPFLDKMWSIGGRFCLFKLPAKTTYNWHKDIKNKVSLNLILTEYDCHTLFSIGHYEYLNSYNMPILDIVTELKYEPRKWYLFNTQIRHKVVNLDSRDRYLLTIVFQNDHSYESLKEILIDNLE